MASSSSSQRGNLSVLQHSGERRNAEQSVKQLDVFINHRGPDVKKTLALQLYNSLEKLGIPAFLDSKEKELGISFPSTIETAISSAKVHIAIFSKTYAESPWCLAELVLMLKTNANIIPVFYEVEPRELRHGRIEKGVYAQAFKEHEKNAEAIKEHEKKLRYKDNIKEWKQALDKISQVAGHEIKKSKCPFGFKNDAPDCKDVVLAVQRLIQRVKDKLAVAKYPVGFPTLVKDFERWFNMDGGGQWKARIVGICGMGGAGKTTLSKELFNNYSSKYTRTSFLFDVREASSRSALPSLQQKLLKDLFDEELPSFTSTSEGITYLQRRLQGMSSVSFLIVLDDVADSKQLDDLLVTDMVNKPGDSLIIITTRDAGLFNRAGIPTPTPYTLKGLDVHNAKILFCFHAFGQSTPYEEYELLVNEFVQACGCLPLSLQILGSHVNGRAHRYWKSALSKVPKGLDQNIKETLKISIEPLDFEAKQIFMDIACFFIGYSKNLAKRVWEASEWEVHHALETLKEKFIVQETGTKRLDGGCWEWDGIDLAMHDHLRDLGREMASQDKSRRRLWDPRDFKSVESTGTGKFCNIINGIKGRCFRSLFDTSMGSPGCQVTYFLAESDDCSGTSAPLLWLQLDLNSSSNIPQSSIPSWIPLQKLQCLRIRNGRLERLWHNRDQVPFQLKELQISETDMTEVPNLEILDHLENVVLDAEYMPIKGWSLLVSLGLNITTICLLSVTLEGTSREESSVPMYLIIRNFKLSEEMDSNESSMNTVENLEIGNQILVTKMFFMGNHWPHLESLKLHHLETLIELDLFRVDTLNSLEVNHCKKLKRVSGVSDLTNLVELNICQCPELDSELYLNSLNCLKSVTVDRCRKLKCLELIDCEMLIELNISMCPELKSELCLSGLYRLKTITVDKCNKLASLELIDCINLETVSGMGGLEQLAKLKIQNCPELRRLPAQNVSCWERIKIDGCEKLNCQAFYSLLNLKIITFYIGRAVEGGESILSPNLFQRVVGEDAVTEMDIPCPAIDQTLVSKIIICGLVAVESSTPLQNINSSSQEFYLRKGRWIVTMVIANPKGNTSFISAAVEGMCRGMLKRGFRVTLMKHQEGETLNLLETIDSKLYLKQV